MTMSELDERTAGATPFRLFETWFADAQLAEVEMPEAMTLATASREGRPSARMVLLKGFDEGGFVFYTNYKSRKAAELEDNPYAALVFFWAQLEYQVRVEGTITRTSEEESDKYFQTRPRESQIGAIASPQSEVIANRNELDRRAEELKILYADMSIERPAHWG
ncbi:MAG TPA: pyridoxamine 5'-phosphate oxidase, partial [Pyrinomonadaceae bacterium]